MQRFGKEVRTFDCRRKESQSVDEGYQDDEFNYVRRSNDEDFGNVQERGRGELAKKITPKKKCRN